MRDIFLRIIIYITLIIFAVACGTPDTTSESSSASVPSITDQPINITTSPTSEAPIATDVTPTLPGASPTITVTLTPTATNTLQPPALQLLIGDIALGMPQTEILRRLGKPQLRTSAHGVDWPQWEYANGLTIIIGAGMPTDPGPAIIQARPPFDGSTAEGFRLGETEARFRQIYHQFSINSRDDPPQVWIDDGYGILLNVVFDEQGKAKLIILTDNRQYLTPTPRPKP